jgi:prepilin-type N-terminal cleavage/methylation domain-containing protein
MSEPDDIVPAGRQSGMTLVEIVVALVVIGMTFAIAAGALRVLARSGGIGTELIGRHDMFSRGIDALRMDIGRLERIALGKNTADPQFQFAGTERTLEFVVMEPPVPSDAGLFLLRYAIIERDGRGLVVRSRAPFVAESPIPPTGDEVTVLDGPYRFSFSYLERRDGRQRWVTRWSDRTSLPVLVKLDVVDGDSATAALPPLVFRPRVEVEHGCAKPGTGPCFMARQKENAPPPAPDKRP